MAERNYLAETEAVFSYKGPYNLDAIIEDAVTDCRGFEPIGRVTKDETAAALMERLGWMDVTRSDPQTLTIKTMMGWALLNNEFAHGPQIVPDTIEFSINTWAVHMIGKGLINTANQNTIVVG